MSADGLPTRFRFIGVLVSMSVFYVSRMMDPLNACLVSLLLRMKQHWKLTWHSKKCSSDTWHLMCRFKSRTSVLCVLIVLLPIYVSDSGGTQVEIPSMSCVDDAPTPYLSPFPSLQ